MSDHTIAVILGSLIVAIAVGTLAFIFGSAINSRGR
jgi:hypothetical protein